MGERTSRRGARAGRDTGGVDELPTTVWSQRDYRSRLSPIEVGGRTAVLSHRLWQRLFTQTDDVAGLELSLQGGGEVLPVVGVASEEFNGVLDGAIDVWILASPAARSPSTFVVENGYIMFGVLPGADHFKPLQSLLASYEFEHKGAEHDSLELVRSIELRPDQRTDVRLRLAGLSLLVLALMTMALTTLVDYLLADHYVRQHEQAIRMAVGATPFDVYRETLVRHGGLVVAMATTAVLLGAYAADVVAHVEPFASYVGELGGNARLVGMAGGALLLTFGFVLSVAYMSRFVSKTSRAIATSGRNLFTIRSSRMIRRVLRPLQQPACC